MRRTPPRLSDSRMNKDENFPSALGLCSRVLDVVSQIVSSQREPLVQSDTSPVTNLEAKVDSVFHELEQ
jgi:hypothetical protein